LGIGLQSNNVIAIEAPEALRGPPSEKDYSISELRSSIVDQDIVIQEGNETWSIYKLEDNGEIRVKNSPISVSRTNKYDRYGLPIYLVNFSADVGIKLPRA